MTDDVYSDEKRDELRKDDAKGREVGMEYAEKVRDVHECGHHQKEKLIRI
jgi:hypothetical protein